MEQISSKLTVFFEEPFWVGVYERWEDGACSACKLTFGAHPKDGQILDLILNGYRRLIFSPAVPGESPPEMPRNPKRAQRAAQREVERRGVGTKAQQALAAQRGQGKEARKQRNRQQKESERQRLFALRQEKRKERRRGR